MSTLRLGAYKLPAAEVVLVQTLFRLYSHGDAFRWTFVTAPPYDALLVDGTTDEGMRPDIDRMAKAVLRLTRMNSGQAPNTLERPIRADRLQEWLKTTEHELIQTRPATQLHPGSTSMAPAAAPVTEPETLSPLRFKLRRWPPAALLRSDPNRIRMATLLSRRALNAAELATISQQPVHECQAFLTTLQTTGLVDVHKQPSAPPPGAPAPAAAPKPAAAPPPAFARGLISGIRRRLGL
ncbi:hypothetical protein [Ottowia testudinis]|uniref:Uncharacterized protein n=1 Tax=Ottowia testudinis TaxID=2816950 RepID=A0A975CIP7_9BURK|nr:hypothetical protein [Ottowia testudinis]QTD46482.1 hypothetical protein J1M35_06260 [Ottowia testudinis]